MVAIIQLAIALGATLGGVMYYAGCGSTFVMSATVLGASALVAAAAARQRGTLSTYQETAR